MNVTVPVAVDEIAQPTVAEKVTESPYVDVAVGNDESIVVVAARFTTRVPEAELAP